jgi:parallel beta-helix repeat protein
VGLRYVAPGGQDTGNDCTDSSAPCARIQRAIDQATPGEEIRVAAGTYSGIVTRGALKQVAYLDRPLSLRGGYTPANWNAPDPMANVTTLDAQGLGRGLVISSTTGVHVEGLRITGGNAQGLVGDVLYGCDVGGGVYVFRAGGSLRSCTIISNTAGSRYETTGGGLYLYQDTFTVRDCVIANNTARLSGGGVCLYDSGAALYDNQILDNQAQYGAGLFADQSSIPFVGNTLAGNSEAEQGGGALFRWCDASIQGNVIRDNGAWLTGGGLEFEGGAPTVYDNWILGNRVTDVTGRGGGLMLDACQGWFLNNVIADNQAGSHGAGLCARNSQASLAHSTLANNTGGDSSAVSVISDPGSISWPALLNSIISGHTVGVTVTQGCTVTLAGTLWHNVGQSWHGAGAVIHRDDFIGDPAFINPGDGDYHIGPTSAALDRALDEGVTWDIDGDPRPQGLAPDCGADEYPSGVTTTLTPTPTPSITWTPTLTLTPTPTTTMTPGPTGTLSPSPSSTRPYGLNLPLILRWR